MDVMDEMVYEALTRYFTTLEKKGYMSYDNVFKLLVLNFYKDFVYNDYRGLITKEDYRLIERALNCLYGTTCLIPYPDYLKMGKLHLGEITEMACRLRNLENTDVIKSIPDISRIINKDMDSDVEIHLETKVDTSTAVQPDTTDTDTTTPMEGNSGDHSGALQD